MDNPNKLVTLVCNQSLNDAVALSLGLRSPSPYGGGPRSPIYLKVDYYSFVRDTNKQTNHIILIAVINTIKAYNFKEF